MPLVCTNCVKNSDLKKLVDLEGQPGVCGLCRENGLVHTSASNRFFQLCKSLIRFNYDEWEYNDHWGADGVESLFGGPDNIFFHEARCVDKSDYDELTADATTFGEVYEDYDKGVTLYAGYMDGEPNTLLSSIKSTLDPRLLEIAERLATENYFVLEDELKHILETYREVATTSVKSGETLFRARVGFEGKKLLLSMSFKTEHHYAPFTGGKIGAPPPHLATAGRANRAGVSFLYCATDVSTAISEIKPHPGDRVSAGAFRVQRDLRAFDLSRSQLFHFFESDQLLNSYIPFNTLATLINKTIPPAERNQYSITQLISDCVRQLGYDALLFSSTVGTGRNVVLFDAGDAKVVDDQRQSFLIDSVVYRSTSEPVISASHEYFEDLAKMVGKTALKSKRGRPNGRS